jgi:XTP/dITP diphosphohydrolase
VGIHVRWLLDHLPDYVGHSAKWIVLLAYRVKDKVMIYQGCVSGKIVEPQGTSGFGFDPVFLPQGSKETLAQSKPDCFNARAKAVEALMKGEIYLMHPVIENWNGPWQQNQDKR